MFEDTKAALAAGHIVPTVEAENKCWGQLAFSNFLSPSVWHACLGVGEGIMPPLLRVCLPSSIKALWETHLYGRV